MRVPFASCRAASAGPCQQPSLRHPLDHPWVRHDAAYFGRQYHVVHTAYYRKRCLARDDDRFEPLWIAPPSVANHRLQPLVRTLAWNWPRLEQRPWLGSNSLGHGPSSSSASPGQPHLAHQYRSGCPQEWNASDRSYHVETAERTRSLQVRRYGQSGGLAVLASTARDASDHSSQLNPGNPGSGNCPASNPLP